MKFRYWFWLAVVAWTLPAAGSDQMRELSYARLLEQTVAPEQLVRLQVGEHSFLAVFTEAERDDNAHSAIILHDSGEYPDQAPLVHGLRLMLPQHGWSSLAIQMPLREKGAARNDYYPLFDEANSRISAASEFLKAKGAKDIAVVGYGIGAAMAAYNISLNPDGKVAFAAISLPLVKSPLPQAQTGDFIRKIALPLLDIYAEFDLPEVTDTALERRLLGKDNPVYRQVKIDGEHHAFQNDSTMLIKRIYSWLTLILDPNY